jgi:diguanylate cyclase (GGDEF)-like protein
VPTTGSELASEIMTTAEPAGKERADTVHTWRSLPWVTIAFLVTGGSVALAAAAGLFGPYESAAIFGIAIATLTALVVSTWVRKPSHLWPWACIAASFMLFLAGGVVRAYLQTVGDLTTSRSIIPDLIILPAYALLGAGLLGFWRRGARGSLRRSSVFLDGLIAALALAAVSWVFVVEPVLAQGDVPLSVKLIMIAYPSMSIFLVVVALRIALNPERSPVPAFWLLLAAMMSLFVGDALYLLADLSLVEIPAQLLDLPYAFAYLFAGAGALHPSMRSLTEPGYGQRMTESRLRIAIVGVALLIPAVLTLAYTSDVAADRAVLSMLMIVLTGAAVLRIVQALQTAERSEARLVFQAHHDSLTGLPNRRMMEEHLSQLLAKTPVDRTHVALLYLDLDRFKLVNDTLGHTRGDELLIEVAERLRQRVRPTDLVTRIGGDEFMIVLNRVVNVSQAVDLANRLRDSLTAPFIVKGMTFYLSASIGLAFASGDDPSATAEALVRDADTAMYQAKDAGRDAVAVFDQSMRDKVEERVELERDLHFAVSMAQLHLVYQPIVRLPHGSVAGMEALVRWSHPTHGVITPAKFIPLAEEAGLISEIGDWVLEESVRQFAAWRRQVPGMADLYISVNLSGAQLHDDHLVQRVADILTLHGLDGSSLCLELTESVVMQDPVSAAATLAELRGLGVQLAIDDFGSEYSSLAYLKRFPVSVLKIDKSFVVSLAHKDSADATLIATIVAMARALGITTVAEGVETRSQAIHLNELGCDSAQGFMYSRPVGPDRLVEVVSSLGTHRLHLVRD